jgi:ATP-dependent DNA ligase
MTTQKGCLLRNDLSYLCEKRLDKTKKESTEALGFLKTKDATEARESYDELLTKGTFECVSFDILFDRGKFVGGEEYLDRHALLTSYGFNPPEIIYDWKKYVVYENGTPKATGLALKECWEGFVLRVPGNSAVTYTLNGKPDRAGAYKFKFMKEGDFVVTEVTHGDSGEHQSLYCRFHLAQYNKKMELVDCGWAGPGTLKRDVLREFTEDIDSKNIVLPIVVEVEFREWTEKNHALEHPVIQRIRFDKRPEECEYEG